MAHSPDTTTTTFQRAWLDVRCSAPGSGQYNRKMSVFLDSFLEVFSSRKESRFRVFFSNGNELVSSICKCLAVNSKSVLRSGEGQSPEEASRARTLNGQLVSALLVLVNPEEYPGRSIAELTSSFELVEESGVVPTLLGLHENELSSVLSATGRDWAASVALDVKYLTLLSRLLGCPQKSFIKRSVAAATQRSFVRLMATTLLKCSVCCATATPTPLAPPSPPPPPPPLSSSPQEAAAHATAQLDDVAERAADVFRAQVLHAPDYDAVRDAADILETGANSTPAKPGSDAVLLAALRCYTCLLEAILTIRSRFGFYEPETVNFSVTAAHVLGCDGVDGPAAASAADTASARDALCHRLAKCVEAFATAKRVGRNGSPSGTPDRRRAGSDYGGDGGSRQDSSSIFQLVPSTFAKFQHHLASSLSGVGESDTDARARAAAASPVQCADAVLSLATVFVSTRAPLTAAVFGDTLFAILRYPNAPFDLIAVVFHVCAEHVGSLDAERLCTLLGFLDDMARWHDTTPCVRTVVDAFKAGHFVNGDCSMLVLDFALGYATRSSTNAAVLLDEGLFAACLVTLSDMLLASHPRTKALTDKVAVLSKVLVQSPQAAQSLEGQNVPRLLLDAMLLACRLRAPEVSVILRDMFTNFVVKTGSFYGTLITAIANCSESTPWRSESSSLLATLVATMQGGKFVEEAIGKNAVELCLTMVHGSSGSCAPEADLQLLGSCLSFLLPRICYSDVWALFEASVGCMECTETHAQFMIDLSSGYFASPTNCAACQRFFESGETHVFAEAKKSPGARVVAMGPYYVPERPFLQLQHPLKTLISWCCGATDVPGATDTAHTDFLTQLRSVVEHLLISSETKLPNEYFGRYILDGGDSERRLLCCLREVTAPEYLPLLFGADTSPSLATVWERQKAWLAVLCPQEGPSVASPMPTRSRAATATKAPIDYRFHAQFAETGGASGTVTCVGEQWPSPDGYTVSTWVHWESMHTAAPSDRKNVVWQLSWSTAHHSSFTVSLSVNPKQQCVFFTYQEGADAKVIDLPFIPENTWVNVTLCHHRGKLSGSQLKAYYDGVLVQTANCPYPSSALQAAVAVAAAGVLPSSMAGGSRDVTCTVGAPREKPNGSVSLRFISFQVFNLALSLEDVVALYCAGAQSHRQGNWDTPADPKVASLLAPYLRDEVLNALTVHQASGNLASLCQRECLVLWATPERAMIRLHARSTSLTEAPLGHMRSNSKWVFVNCTNAPSTDFSVHGSFIPPQAGMANEVDTLLAHGAMYEWVCWLDAISASASGHDGDASAGCLATTHEVAKAFLRILVASNKQTELSPSSWRRLLGRLIEEAIRYPEVYLRDRAALLPLLSLSVRSGSSLNTTATTTTIRKRSGTTSAPSSSPSASASGAVQENPIPFTRDSISPMVADGVLYSTTVLEHIFFNWKVLGRLPPPTFRTVLTVFESLLTPSSNVYHEVNALRFLAADFVNGFICGMFREFVTPACLQPAMRCVELVIRALWRNAEFLGDLLTLCSVSLTSEGVGMGSRLAAVCPAYGALVRNLLLRTINAVWDSLALREQQAFAGVLSSVLSAPWITVMTGNTVHPATAVLSARLFVVCFQQCESFRDGFRGERLLCLVETLSAHSHQRDVMDLVLHAVVGLVWPLPRPNGTAARRSYDSLPLQNESGTLPFLDILLHLTKRLSQLLLGRPEDIVSACIVDGSSLDVYQYFDQFFERAAAGSSFPEKEGTRIRFKTVALLALCTVRLSGKRRMVSTGHMSVTAEARGSGVVGPSGVSEEGANVKSSVLENVRDIVDWLALRYRGSRGLQKALYRSDNIANAADLLCWPLLCTLDARSVDMAESEDQRNRAVAATLPPINCASTAEPSEEERKSVPAEDDDWEDVGNDFDDDDGGDEDWEMLPVVATTDSRSCGLDHLRPRAGFERVYDSCRSFYLTHALERVTDGEEFALPRGRVRMSKFVLALHRALAAEPRAVGNQVEDCRAAFLCTVWMKAAEQSIDQGASSSSSSPPGVKNVLSLGDYLLSRLVSGAAVPPLALSTFFRFLLARLDRNTEVVRRCRTSLFEWLMYVMNGAYYKYDGPRAAAVVDMLVPNAEMLFAVPVPAGDLLRIMSVRLMELTHTCLCWAENTGEASGDGSTTTATATATATAAAATALRKLAVIWQQFINANKDAGALLGLLQAPGKPDLWTNGCSNLLQYPPTKATDDFVAWLVANKADLWRCFQGGADGAPFTYAIAEGAKYAKLMRTSVLLHQKQAGEEMRFIAESRKRNDAAWAGFLDTTTFVDPTIVEHGGFTFPNSCVVMANSDGARGVANELQWWFLHQSGTVGVKELYAHENVDDLASEPISLYIRYPPPVCLPLRLHKAETTSPYCSLRWNALSVLSKITGRGVVRWIGNVYYVVGNDSRICTITLTEREVVLVSCSEFTSDGDFFIAQIRPQTARQKSAIKTTFMQQTWRRLLTTAGGVTSGGAGGGQLSGTATSSKAAFRYSQYYRQLRTEALANAEALVWRFPLGTVASVHQRLFQHMPAGLEFVLETGERFLVVVLDEELSFSKATRDKLQSAVAELAPLAEVETMGTKRAKLTSLTRRWASGDVSNYDYLKALNDAASRTVADIGQYPVMPWVLQDYKSDSLDLDTAAIYRDLTKPVGALHPAKVEQLQRRYQEWVSDDGGPPFHYGTHYSSGAIVLYYLIRLQPFTARSISYQGGRLDIADRLFSSLSEAWENSSGPGTGDVKELIPEFFTLGACFTNKNRTALGTRRDGRLVDDVVLPPWAQGRPTVFTHVNALALESAFASEHLNHWIDLIFGYKQTGEAAVAAVNVFHSLSYQEGVEQAINNAVSEENRKAIVASADNFGQTPVQLFTRGPHIPRNLAAPARQQYLIHNVKSVCPATVLPEGRVVTAVRGTPFTRLFDVDQVVYGCPSNHTMSTGGSKEVFVYDGRTDCVSSTLARQTRPNATLPPIRSLGCGDFSCMCVSASGNLLCVGTDAGKVVVFSRGSPDDVFAISTVLHSAHPQQDGVIVVQLFGEGCLVASHGESATVTGWHISPLGSMFSYKIQLPPCDSDKSPVCTLTHDDQRGVYYGGRAHSVVLFTGEGILLRQFSCSPFLDALSAKLGLDAESRWDVTSMEFCNCSSFCEENVFLLGHQNGALTFWVATAQTYSDARREHDFYQIRFLHSLTCDRAVSCVMLRRSGGVILAGLENGTIAQFCYPSAIDESPLVMTP